MSSKANEGVLLVSGAQKKGIESRTHTLTPAILYFADNWLDCLFVVVEARNLAAMDKGGTLSREFNRPHVGLKSNFFGSRFARLFARFSAPTDRVRLLDRHFGSLLRCEEHLQ